MQQKITKEDLLAKIKNAQEKKRLCLIQLEKNMKESYKKRTGKDAKNFFAL